MARSKKKSRRDPRREKARGTVGLALYAIQQLPETLRNDVLSNRRDTEIASITSIPTITIGPSSVPRSILFETLRAALRTGVAQIMAMKSNSAKVTVSEQGYCSVEVGGTTHHISNVDLAAENVSILRAAIDRMTSETSLPASMLVDVRSKASQPLTEQDFFGLLGAFSRSPVGVIDEFRRAAADNRVSPDAIFSPDEDYLSSLLPTPTASSLRDFVTAEFDAEFGHRFDLDPRQAFVALSRLFSCQSILRSASLIGIASPNRLDMLRSLVRSQNPFALVGGIELCAAGASADKHLVSVGRDLLQALVDRIPDFSGALEVFGAVFCVTMARLRVHSKLRSRPAYWRRLAAAAHAAVILEAEVEEMQKPNGLLRWAIQSIGTQYFFTAALEKEELPRWQPEWIEPQTLLADLVGRLRGCEKLDLDGWNPLLAKLTAHLEELGLQQKAVMPSLFEADLEVIRKPASDFPDFLEYLEDVKKEGTAEALLRLQAMTYGYALLDEVPLIALGCMEEIARKAGSIGQPFVLPAIRFAADVAIFARDQRLSAASAEALLVVSRDLPDDVSITEILVSLVLCAQTLPSSERAETLSRWFMSIVRLQTDRGTMFQIREELQRLGELDNALRPSLAQAIAFASLGADNGLTPYSPLVC